MKCGTLNNFFLKQSVWSAVKIFWKHWFTLMYIRIAELLTNVIWRCHNRHCNFVLCLWNCCLARSKWKKISKLKWLNKQPTCKTKKKKKLLFSETDIGSKIVQTFIDLRRLKNRRQISLLKTKREIKKINFSCFLKLFFIVRKIIRFIANKEKAF